MTIEKLEEFASNGDKHLTGLDVATGFPRADKPERPWFNKLFGDITGKINEVVDSVDGLPPFDNGVLADTFVTATANMLGSVARTQRDKNSDTVSVKDFGAKGNGSTDDSVNLQKALTHQDVARTSSTFIPMQYQNYVIDNTLVLQEPSMIYGNKGASYNRGAGKNGNLILRDAMIGIDLGNSRVWDIDNPADNPADNWTIKNIGFINHPTATVRTKTAIKHTAATNGPDRGFIVREVSTVKMLHGLLFQQHDTETQLATVVVENCVFLSNSYAVKAEGSVYGARFVGNQMEWNVLGCITGNFVGPLTIHDNMLEGGGNAVDIYRDNPKNLNSADISIARNYFEANYGDYALRFDAGVNGTLVSEGNYFNNFHGADGFTPKVASNLIKDHYLLSGRFKKLHIYDKPTVTFEKTYSVSVDNNLERYLVYAEEIYSGSVHHEYGGKTPEYEVGVGRKIMLNEVVETPLGIMYCVGAANGAVPVGAVVENDVVQVVTTYYSTEYGVNPDGIGFYLGGTPVSAGHTLYNFSPSGIQTITSTLRIPKTKSGTLGVRLTSSDPDKYKSIKVLAATMEKIGTYVENPTSRIQNRFPVVLKNPRLTPISKGHVQELDIAGKVVPAAGTVVGGVVYMVGLAADTIIKTKLVLETTLPTGLSIEVTNNHAIGNVVLTIKNTGDAPVTFSEGEYIKLVVKANLD